MLVCVHCARGIDALHTTLGSGHVVLVRCKCGQVADPYLEYGAVAVFLDFLLVKPRAYRHVLYNATHRHTIPIAGTGERDATAREFLFTHARRLLAVVLVESYLVWFYSCVHHRSCSGEYPLADAMPSAARIPLGIFIATLLDIVIQHAAVTCVVRAVRRVPLLLPSMALLFARVSTLLLSVLLLVWDSKLPAERVQRHRLPLFVGEFSVDTSWIVRVIIGGMAAGVALGVVLPRRPAAAACAVLFASAAHLGRYRLVNLRDP